MTEQKKEMRFNDAELQTIKDMFGNNPQRLKLMRKVFLPELERDAPLGQIIDLAMSINTKDKSPEEIAIAVQARNELISHVEQMLIQLNVLANAPSETESERKVRLEKNSTK